MKTVSSLVLILSLTIASSSPSIAKDETLPKEGSPTSVIEGPDGSSIVSSVKPGFVTKNVIKGPSAVTTVTGSDAPKENDQNQVQDAPRKIETFQEKRLKSNHHILRPKPIHLVGNVPELVPQVLPEIPPQKPLSLNGLLSLLNDKNKPHKPHLPPCKLPPIQKPPSNCGPLVRPPVLQPQLPIALPPPPYTSCPHHASGHYPHINYPQTAQSSQLLNGLVGSVLQLLLLSSLQPNYQNPNQIYLPQSYVPPHWLRPTPHDEYIDNSQEKFKETLGNENKFAVAENEITLQDVQPLAPAYTPHNLLIPSNLYSYYNYPWTRYGQRIEELTPTTAIPKAE